MTEESNGWVAMYVTRMLQGDPRGNVIKVVVHHRSMAELRGWVEGNNLMLATPMTHSPFFSVEHADGSKLTPDELDHVRTFASESQCADRMEEMPPGLRDPLLGPGFSQLHKSMREAQRRSAR